MNKPLFKKLLRDLGKRWLTLLALVLVLAAGVSSYVGMKGVYLDLNTARIQYYQKYNFSDFTIDLKRAPETVMSRLHHLPNVVRLRDRVMTPIMVDFAHHIQPIPGEALSLPAPRHDILNNVWLYRGRYFSRDDAREVILDQQFAAARHIQIGDRISVRLPDQSYDLLVVGTSYAPEFVVLLAPGNYFAPDPENFAVMYMPRRFLQEHAELNGAFNQVLGIVRQHSETAVRNTMTLLADKLGNYGVTLQTAQKDQSSASVLHDELNNVKAVVKFFPTLFLLVAVLILNIMLLRLITQQRTVIGTLKALGYSHLDLIRHYLSYGIIIGVLGGIVGVTAGIWLEYYMLQMYKMFFVMPNMIVRFHWDVYLIGFAISLLATLLGSLVGAYRAMKLNPADAMRPPMPERTTHIFLEKWSHFWKHLSFQRKMIVRAIFRNPIRSLVTLFSAVVATALIFTALSFFDSLTEMITFTFDTMQHQDYNLTLREPLGRDMLSTLHRLPGVKTVETQLNVPAEITNNPYYKLMTVTGLPKDHKLFTPVDRDKKIIAIDDSGLIFSERLANLLHVHVGDFVWLKPLIAHREKMRVQVRRIVPTYLGVSAYANQRWLSHLLGDSFVSSNILFSLNSGANERDFIRAMSQFAPMINLMGRKNSMRLFEITMDQFLSFAIMIMVVFAAIIAIGAILNTAIVSLSERERDVASLRVIGFTHWQVAKIFIGESVILNTIGTLLGLLGGMGLSYYMVIVFRTDLFRMPFVVNPTRLLESVLVMALFIAVSQMIIYRIILKVKWLEVLNTRE